MVEKVAPVVSSAITTVGVNIGTMNAARLGILAIFRGSPSLRTVDPAIVSVTGSMNVRCPICDGKPAMAGEEAVEAMRRGGLTDNENAFDNATPFGTDGLAAAACTKRGCEVAGVPDPSGR